MNQTIYKAMRAHLNTLANKPPIAYLDQPYSPTGAQYLREGFYSASPDHLAGYLLQPDGWDWIAAVSWGIS